jgi:hypothetical protein
VFMIRVESKEDASTRAKPLNWFNFSRLDITWTIRLHLRCQILCMFLFLASTLECRLYLYVLIPQNFKWTAKCKLIWFLSLDTDLDSLLPLQSF